MKTQTTSRTIPDATAEPTISAKRAASILGISLRHTYAAIERDEIPAIRVGRSIVIPTARFLDKYRLAPADNTPATAA